MRAVQVLRVQGAEPWGGDNVYKEEAEDEDEDGLAPCGACVWRQVNHNVVRGRV